MYCGTEQLAASICTICSKSMGVYYCNICKLWNNDTEKSIYHCQYCNICRIGKGLGIDYFHCEKCRACLPVQMFNKHTCIERTLDVNCPICWEVMFDSQKESKILPCGHAIHTICLQEYKRDKCPFCSKNITPIRTSTDKVFVIIIILLLVYYIIHLFIAH